METIITKELALKAVLMGACRIPKVGKTFSELSQADLVWAELMFDKQEWSLPLFVMCKSGYGFGYGSGDVLGSGDGLGFGYGSGDVLGSGYGSGYVLGSGDGSGDVLGSGDGLGDGKIEKALTQLKGV